MYATPPNGTLSLAIWNFMSTCVPVGTVGRGVATNNDRVSPVATVPATCAAPVQSTAPVAWFVITATKVYCGALHSRLPTFLAANAEVSDEKVEGHVKVDM